MDYKEKMNSLSARFKAAPEKKPLQEVKPLDTTVKEEEVQLMLWVSKPLMREIKKVVLNTDSTIRETVTLAIKNYIAIKNTEEG